MIIPEDCLTPDTKFRDYLLVRQKSGDKSLYLEKSGYTRDNWMVLRDVIRHECIGKDARFHKQNVNGKYYELDILLPDEKKKKLWVKTIWLQDNVMDSFRFITLVPISEGDIV